jgi:hypothetical protein
MEEKLDNLEQPVDSTDSKELNFESENDLLDSVRNLAEQIKNGIHSELSEESSEDTKDSEGSTEADEDNKETKPDEEIDLAEWLDKYELPYELTLKSKGLETKTKKLSELFTLANAGLDYTKKRQEEAPLRKVGEYVNQQGLSLEELQILADAKRGDKAAFGTLAKQYGVDVYDIDTEAKYNPTPQSAYVEHNEAEEIAKEIYSDPTLLQEVQNSFKSIPHNVAEEIVSRADLLDGFRKDVSTGVAQKVIPEVNKRMTIDSINKNNIGKNFYQYYGEVANELLNRSQQQAVQQVEPKQQVVNSIDKAKAGVSSTKISNSTNSVEIDVWSKNLSPDELIEQIKLKAQQMRG